MPTQLNGTNGADGASGATGADATDLLMPSGDGGDGANGGDGGDLVVTVAQEDVDADPGHDLRYYGGIAGNGGMGGYAGDLFNDHQAVRTGDHEVQNDYFSAAGAGGNGGDAGDGGSVAITATDLVLGDGVTLLATGSNGGWAGAGNQGGAGATDIHNTEAIWQTYVDDELVQHNVSLDYTSHGASGGHGGDGGVGGDAGNASLDFTGNKVQSDVWLVAHGGNGGFGWVGGSGGAGNDPAIGGVGGHGGRGGDATLTVDGNSFGFNAAITFTAWGGTGGLGGVGGSGGYGLTAEGVEGTYDLDYTYAKGGVGGDGGDAGSGVMSITDNWFGGGDFADHLNLSFHLNSGAVGTGGAGGVGALESEGYDAANGADGAYGSTGLWFDGNVLDGEGGVDTLNLLINNMTAVISSDGSGLTPLATLDINLFTGTLLLGAGVNAIDDIENVSVYYADSYYSTGGLLHRFGNVSVTGNASNNILTTGGGDDYVDGGGGNDTLNAGNGNDVLVGGLGTDKMIGGGGNDTYHVDNTGDTITELSGQGVDSVFASTDFNLGGFSVENIALTGTAGLTASGNSLDNIITGNDGNNILNGGAGADSLDGGIGADRLYGGSGDDTYVVDNAGDTVYEKMSTGADAGGTDIVFSSVAFILGNFVENLTLTGSDNINGFGNSLDNTINGNDGNNRLKGGAGSDTLTGGLGHDVFFFETTSGLDTITDFSASEGDQINIHAYSLGVTNASSVHIATGTDGSTVIDLGGGNVITVLNASTTDVTSHILW